MIVGESLQGRSRLPLLLRSNCHELLVKIAQIAQHDPPLVLEPGMRLEMALVIAADAETQAREMAAAA